MNAVEISPAQRVMRVQSACNTLPTKETEFAQMRENLLREACKSASEEQVQALLASGIDPNLNTSALRYMGHTITASGCLHIAARKGNPAIVSLLITHGAEVNVKDESYGDTPLHKASHAGHASVVQKLIQAGADVRIQNSDGNLPLHLVCRRNLFPSHRKTCLLLLIAGSDVNVMNSAGKVPKVDEEDQAMALYFRIFQQGLRQSLVFGCIQSLYKQLLNENVTITHIQEILPEDLFATYFKDLNY